MHTGIFFLTVFLGMVTGDPYYNVTPEDVEAPLGSTVVLKCQVLNMTQGANYVIWRKLQPVHKMIFIMGSVFDPDIPERYQLVGSALTGEFNMEIRDLRRNDSGTYECGVAKSTLRAVATVAALIVPGAPVITQNKTAGLREGDVVEFVCSSSGGYPTPDIIWIRNGQPVPNLQHISTGGTYRDARSIAVITLDRSDNGGTLTCSVSNKVNEANPLTTSVSLEVQYKPVLAMGPYRQYGVQEGQGNVVLTCDVSANPPVSTIVWKKGAAILPTGNSPELRLTSVQKADAGNYVCSATNALGTTQADISLDVFYPPVVSAPAEVEVAEGQELTVKCEVDANPPPSSLVWRWADGRPLLLSNPYVSVLDGQLRIRMTKREHTGTLQCVATNSMPLSGRDAPLVSSATADIDIVVMYGPSAASIDTVPAAFVGDDITMKCNVQDLGQPRAQVEWRNGKSAGVLAQGTEYTIQKLALGHEGSYTCKARNAAGEGGAASIDLQINERPQWQSPKLSVEQVVRSDRRLPLSLKCNVTGKPRPLIKWIFDSQEIDTKSSGFNITSRWQRLAAGNFEVVSILDFVGPARSRLTSADGGHYTCEAYSPSSAYPAARQTQTLVVQYPPIVTASSPRLAVDLSNTLEITCVVQSQSPPTITWTGPNGPLRNGSRVMLLTRVNATDYRVSQLSLSRVENKDRGTYTCRAVNEIGSGSATTDVISRGKPDAPTDLRLADDARAVTWGSVLLTWTPGFDGGASQTFHILVKSERDNFTLSLEPSDGYVGNITGLAPSTNYTLRVRSSNTYGDSDVSAPLYQTTEDLTLPSARNVVFNPRDGVVSFVEEPLGLCLKLETKTGSEWEISEACAPAQTGSVRLHASEDSDVRVSVCLVSRSDICGAAVNAQKVQGDLSQSTVIIISCVCVLVLLILLAILVFLCFRRRRMQQQKKAESLKTSDAAPAKIAPPIVGGSALTYDAAKPLPVLPRDNLDLDDPTCAGIYGQGSITYSHSSHLGYTPRQVAPVAPTVARTGSNGSDHNSTYEMQNCINSLEERDPRLKMDSFEGIHLDYPDYGEKLRHVSGDTANTAPVVNDPAANAQKGGSLSSTESGYTSSPERAKPKKIFYEVVV